MADDALLLNDTGRAQFVRDEHGELIVVKPGQPMPRVAPPAAKAAADEGEKEGFFSDALRKNAASARAKATQPAAAADAPPLLALARAGDDNAVRAACHADSEAVHAKDHLERTALHLAAYAGHASTVELLLAFYAKHSPLACDSTTPLHFAAQCGHAEVCELLIKAGAKVNARGTKRNDTPLHLCAHNGHAACLEFLLTKNADTRLRNIAKRTALDVASTEETKALLAAAALRKRPKEVVAARACAADEDEDGVEVVDGPPAKQARPAPAAEE